MKKNLLSIISYGLLGYTVASGVIIGVPELNELVPQFTNQVAVWTGLPAGTLGALGITLQNYINNARKVDNEIAKSFTVSLDKVFDKLNGVIKQQEKVISELSNKYNVLEDNLHKLYETNVRLVNLLETDLRAKLSNTLIDEKVKELIEGVLDEV